ncbi:MAG: glycosyltransferase family 29 protein [Methanobrevibacter sp.]|nr:glycosyltransferase family 29 protein [Methanobrevibacter sp.]
MIIVYCLDNAYVPFAEISIQTVKKHNPDAKIVIVSEKPINVNGADEYYVWDLGGIHRNRGEGDRISNAAYLKLLLPRLPYDKVLFLDGDVICQHPLDNLWGTSVEYIGLCESHSYGKKQAEDLGIDRYGLSGMMLLNLKNLRQIDFTKKAFEKEKDIPTPKTGWHHEETILNTCFYDLLEFLPIRYNYCFHREYEKPIDYNDAIILHICGKDKSYMFEYARKQEKYPELSSMRPEIQEKRIAIVGDSLCIFDGKYGKDIDGHDFIIRFNKGFIKDGECQGTRTDLLILACPMSGNEISMFKPRYVANRSRSYVNKADFTINSYERAVMKNALGKQPSTGFMAVNICLTFGAKEINLFGFDGSGISYPNEPNYKTQHDMKKELEIYKGYEAVGLLKIHGAD